MTSYNSCVEINQLHSSSFRWLLLPTCGASLQPAINCGHPVSGGWACLLIGHWRNRLWTPTDSLSSIDFYYSSCCCSSVSANPGHISWFLLKTRTNQCAWQYCNAPANGHATTMGTYCIHGRDSWSDIPRSLRSADLRPAFQGIQFHF